MQIKVVWHALALACGSQQLLFLLQDFSCKYPEHADEFFRYGPDDINALQKGSSFHLSL